MVKPQTALTLFLLMIFTMNISLGFPQTPCPANPEQEKHDCFGFREASDDKISLQYTGYFMNNQFEGEGTLVFVSPERSYTYVGKFKKGLFNGEGTFFTNLGVITGNFVNNKAEGLGTATFKNGNIFEGTFKDDVPYSGTMVFGNDDEYEPGYSFTGKFVSVRPAICGTLFDKSKKEIKSSFEKCATSQELKSSQGNQECALYPNKCSFSQLCAFATESDGVINQWSTNPLAKRHIDFALDLYWKDSSKNCFSENMQRISENMIPKKSLCSREGTLAYCTENQLCALSTRVENGRVVWNDSFKKGVSYAQNVRKFDCGVLTRNEWNAQIIAEEFRRLSSTNRKHVQASLKFLGYYSSSIDGLWGSKTSAGILKYVSDREIVPSLKQNESTTKLFKNLRDQYNYTPPKQKVTTASKKRYETKNSIITAIVSNPQVSAKQAIKICEAAGRAAANNASSRYVPKNQTYSSNCYKYGFSSYSCTTKRSTGGGWAGGLNQVLDERESGIRAGRLEAEACMAHYGWAVDWKSSGEWKGLLYYMLGGK